MGGNVYLNGKQAEKIPVKEIGLKKFQKDFKSLVKEINKIFHKEYGIYIWNDSIIDNGDIFNGSTNILMNPLNLEKEEELARLKPSSGDIDLVIPENLSEQVDKFLNDFSGNINNFEYIGCKGSKNSQTITLWKYCYEKDKCVYAQIDFEYLPYEDEMPSAFSKFSHSSTFDDMEAQVKGVFHKYLLRSIARISSKLGNVEFATKASKCGKIRISKAKKSDPHYLKFSILRGLRVAYEPMICDGEQVYENGVPVYKEIPTDKSIYKTNPNEIFEALFGVEPNSKEEKMFWSYVGLLEIMKNHFDKKTIEEIFNSFFTLLWDLRGDVNISQQLEKMSPEIDKIEKMSAINRFIKVFPYTKNLMKQDIIDKYYINYEKNLSRFEEGFEKSIFKSAFKSALNGI